jgi:hypothetical protein
LATAVAIRTIGDRVLPCQWISIVRKAGASPTAVVEMAELALGQKPCGNVIGII